MLNEETLPALSGDVRFVLEIDKLKRVLRKVKPLREERYENAAEHSWQIAVFALSIAQTLAHPIQMERVLAMLLIHDVGEIDAGDKFVFAHNGWEEHKAAELRAVERIFGLAPANVSANFLNLWNEFEAGETREAKFARAIDRSMPVLLNLSNGGGSWLENGVSYERVVRRIQPEIKDGCPELWDYLKTELDKARDNGFFATTALGDAAR